MLWAQGMAG